MCPRRKHHTGKNARGISGPRLIRSFVPKAEAVDTLFDDTRVNTAFLQDENETGIRIPRLTVVKRV